MSPQFCVFVTGASGTVGRPLITELARVLSTDGIAALQHAEPVGIAGTSIRVVEGDITRDGLGLAPREADALCSEVTTIIHSASNTRFDAPLHDASMTNVDGTRHVLAFARRCRRLERVAALSTVHVAGRRTGTIFEDELEHTAGFVNTYEETKYDAERELRKAMSDLPIAVVRISTITGDSCTGDIAKRAGVHQAVRFMYRGLAPMVPGSEGSPVDFVALDHVVRSIAWLATSGFEAGATWHLCAGGDAVPFGELLDSTRQTFVDHRPSWRKRTIERPAIVDLPTFELFCRSVEEAGDSILRAATAVISRFAPQLAFPKRFDDKRCREALARGGIVRPASRPVWSRMVQHLIEPERSDLETRLLEFVRTRLVGDREVEIDRDTYLFERGLVDSLKILQLIAFIEHQIGRSVPDTDVVMKNFRTVGTMASHFGS